jgi:hypothetical protein
MGIVGFGQRRRTSKLLADQLSVMRTGQTQAELCDQATAEQEARILYKALTRRGTDPGIAAYL